MFLETLLPMTGKVSLDIQLKEINFSGFREFFFCKICLTLLFAKINPHKIFIEVFSTVSDLKTILLFNTLNYEQRRIIPIQLVHLPQFSKNLLFLAIIILEINITNLSTAKINPREIINISSLFDNLKVLRQPSQKFQHPIFLQQPLPNLPKIMLSKYLQNCMYSFRENWEINIRIFHSVPLFNPQLLTISLKSKVLFQRFSKITWSTVYASMTWFPFV